MNYKNCYLYGLKSKKRLLELLHIDRKVYCKSSFINCKISPYISSVGRLIEAPDEDIKIIQTRILRALQHIDVPSFVFSGIKGKCYIDNAKAHSGKKCLFKIDISKFFPNTSRNKVYKFYLQKLDLSPDVANILTNFSTINVDLKNQDNNTIKKVNEFIKEKNIKLKNHLITGSPLSSIMSYFANIDMFEKMYEISKKNGIDMTVYVDDVVFSSNKRISESFRETILKILSLNGYNISKSKCKYYNVPYNKRVTGVIIDTKGKMQVPNKLILKTHKYIEEVKNEDFTHIQNLAGCLVVTKSINGKFKELHGQIKLSKEKKK